MARSILDLKPLIEETPQERPAPVGRLQEYVILQDFGAGNLSVAFPSVQGARVMQDKMDALRETFPNEKFYAVSKRSGKVYAGGGVGIPYWPQFLQEKGLI